MSQGKPRGRLLRKYVVVFVVLVDPVVANRPATGSQPIEVQRHVPGERGIAVPLRLVERAVPQRDRQSAVRVP